MAVAPAEAAELPAAIVLNVNDRVKLSRSRIGTVKYVGAVQFAEGVRGTL